MIGTIRVVSTGKETCYLEKIGKGTAGHIKELYVHLQPISIFQYFISQVHHNFNSFLFWRMYMISRTDEKYKFYKYRLVKTGRILHQQQYNENMKHSAIIFI